MFKDQENVFCEEFQPTATLVPTGIVADGIDILDFGQESGFNKNGKYRLNVIFHPKDGIAGVDGLVFVGGTATKVKIQVHAGDAANDYHTLVAEKEYTIADGPSTGDLWDVIMAEAEKCQKLRLSVNCSQANGAPGTLGDPGTLDAASSGTFSAFVTID